MSEPTKTLTYEQMLKSSNCQPCANGRERLQFSPGGKYYHAYHGGATYECTAPTREAYEQSLRERLNAANNTLTEIAIVIGFGWQPGLPHSVLTEGVKAVNSLAGTPWLKDEQLRAANERAERLERELEGWKKLSAHSHRELHALKIGLADAEQREDALKQRVKRLERIGKVLLAASTHYNGCGFMQSGVCVCGLRDARAEWRAALAGPTPKCPKCHDTGSIPNGTDEMACDCLGQPTKPADPPLAEIIQRWFEETKSMMIPREGNGLSPWQIERIARLAEFIASKLADQPAQEPTK